MKKLTTTLLFSLLFVSFLAIGEEKKKLPKEDYVITIDTEFGQMILLLSNATPKHKENFIKLATSGFYNGTTF
ncbi:MAG TPA: peptidylprolyl isomerase, partial [Cytophagaceae bacterium]|nr:peptidylprolyl isomerase [Cytophagaceae bacterium]